MNGKLVVVTRPRAGAEDLTRALRALGARVVSLPLIRIQPPRRRRALSFDSYHWVAFTSRNGAKAVAPELARLRHERPRVAAIGPGTAQALRREGIRPDLVARTSTGAGLASALRRSTKQDAIRVLHPTSDRARRAFREQLSEAGHQVTEVVAYRTLPTRPPSSALRRRVARADAIVVCSPSAVAQLHARRLLAPCSLLACIGPVTADAARELGFRIGAVASRPTPRALAAAVARALEARR